MPTNVSDVQQYVRGLIKGRPLGVLSVTDFGAVGDGQVDDTAAIQAAIDAAQAAFDAGPVTVPNRISQSPAVYFPEGTYKTTATLNVARQLRLYGAGYMSSIVAGTANSPVFNVNVTSQREYAAATFEHLSICGNSALSAGKESQHGIRVQYTASGLDATLDVRFCSIQSCGGHGLYFPDNANTPRIFGCIINTNWLDGIHFSGTFATNARILHNVIRENRRGVVYDGTTAAGNVGMSQYLYSGHIAFNLFEGNHVGSGQVGSSTRPAQGVTLLNAREVVVESNYFERQLNHVFVGVAAFRASAYCQIARNLFYGVSAVPGDFPGFNGPAQRPCDIALASGSLVGIVCRDNQHEIPTRPSGTSTTDWSGNAWGDVLPVFAVIDGQQHVIDEGWGNGAGVATTDVPLFRKLSDLGQENYGVTRGPGGGLLLSSLDGTLTSNEFLELKGQITPSDASGKSAIRFARRSDGGAYLGVHANDNTDTLRLCAQFLGQEQAVQVGTGGLLDANQQKVVGTRGAAVANASATVASVQAQLNALLARLRAHGLIAP